MSVINLGSGQVQTREGEEVQVDQIVAYIRPEKAVHPYRGFVIMNAAALIAMSEMDLSPLELRLFCRIVAEMPIGNVGHINQTRSAEMLNTSRESVNRALSSLVRRGMLDKSRIDGDLLWKVSPEYAWKGKTQGLVTEYRNVRAKAMRGKLKTIEGGKA